jgi:hypothetical protein
LKTLGRELRPLYDDFAFETFSFSVALRLKVLLPGSLQWPGFFFLKLALQVPESPPAFCVAKFLVAALRLKLSLA